MVTVQDELLKLGALGNAFIHAVVPFVRELQPGEFKKGKGSEWIYTPAKFIAVAIRPRKQKVEVTLWGPWRDFESVIRLKWQDGRWGYNKCGVDSVSQLDSVLLCIRKAHDSFMGKPRNQRKVLSREAAAKRLEAAEKRQTVMDELTERLADEFLNLKIPQDVVDVRTGELLIPANKKITRALLARVAERYDHVELDAGPARTGIFEIIRGFERRLTDLD